MPLSPLEKRRSRMLAPAAGWAEVSAMAAARLPTAMLSTTVDAKSAYAHGGEL